MSPDSWGTDITFNNEIILPVAQQLALMTLCQWILRLHPASTGCLPWFCPQKKVDVCFKLMIWLPATHADRTLTKKFFIFLPWYSNGHSLVFYHQANLSSNSVDEKINNDCCTRLVQFRLTHFYRVKFQTFTNEKGGRKVQPTVLTWT